MRILWISSFSVFLSIIFGVMFNDIFQPAGLKINWILSAVLVLSFKYRTALFPFFALLPGLIADVLSHGILGIYGMSFFISTLIAYKFYADTRPGGLLACMSAVFFFSIIEGGIALFLLHFITPELPWKQLLWMPTFAVALLNLLCVPLFYKLIEIMEQKKGFL